MTYSFTGRPRKYPVQRGEQSVKHLLIFFKHEGVSAKTDVPREEAVNHSSSLLELHHGKKNSRKRFSS